MVERALQAVSNDVKLDRGLHDALVAVKTEGLEPGARRFVERTRLDLALAGVDRDDATRAELATLHARFLRPDV